MLWERWGSSTGKYSSGFEEEFGYVRKRYYQSGFPTIWLCFKEIEARRLEDPGEQLKQVLAFREQQIQAKEFLFKTFDDSADWRDKLDEWLLKYVLDLAKKASDEERQESSAQTQNTVIDASSSDLSGLESAEPHVAAAKEQLLDLTDNVRQFIEPSTSKENLSWLEIARLSLFSKSMVINHYEDECFTNHEIHLIYQYREQIEVSGDEVLPLIKTIVNDLAKVKAGWYWFKDSNVSNLLFYVASKTQDSNLLKQILDLLKKTDICLTSDNDKRSEIRKFILTTESSENKIDWLSYLGSTGTIEDLPIASSACHDDYASVRAAADEARNLILARYKPNELLEELLESKKTLEESIAKKLTERIDELDTKLLFRSLTFSQEDFRIFSLNELILRKEISEAQLRELVTDNSQKIKEASYKAIINLGGSISLDDIGDKKEDSSLLTEKKSPEIRLTYFNSLAPDNLMDYIKSSLVMDINYAYRALSENHFNYISERVRDDLKDEFSTFLEREILDYKRLKHKDLLELYDQVKDISAESTQVTGILDSKSFDEFKETIIELLVQLEVTKKFFEEHIKYDFIAAALSGLVLYGNPGDIIWGRKYLELRKFTEFGELLQISAIKLVELYGDQSDIEVLIKVSESTYGDISRLAAKAAIKLSPGVKGVASSLLSTERPDLAFIAVDSFNSQDKSEAFELLEPMLAQDNSAFRSCALLYFLKFSSAEELEGLLNRYMQNRYYYSVVCMIDRILYSPSPYKEMYLNEFESEIKNTYLR